MPSFFSYISWFQIFLLMVGLMSGIFSLVREVLLINHPEKAKDGHLFWRCVFITFIISSVWLWVSEHQQTLDLQGKLDALTTPALTADFGELFRPASTHPSDVMVTVSGVVKNQGAPTIIDHWGFYVVLNNGKKIVGTLGGVPKPQDIISQYDDHNKLIATFFGYRYWLYTVSSSPIPTGGGGPGWLIFVLPNTSREEIFDKQATVYLTARDVNGHEWTFMNAIAGRSEVPPSLEELGMEREKK